MIFLRNNFLKILIDSNELSTNSWIFIDCFRTLLDVSGDFKNEWIIIVDAIANTSLQYKHYETKK